MNLSLILLSYVAVLISITFHEYMHGYVAFKMGDETAKNMGRLTLNPLAHIDPFGTILLPLLLSFVGLPAFGYAKPVPINPNNFKNWRKGEFLTSLAGPGANLVLIFLFSTIFKLIPVSNSIFGMFILYAVAINVVLMVFNLIPIPPLDGSKILYTFLPDSFPIENIERYGFILIIPLIYIFGRIIIPPVLTGAFHLLGLPLNIF